MVVMILALVVTVIGSGTMVVKNAYDKIIVKAEAQVLMSTAITKVKDELRFSGKYDNSGADAMDTDLPVFLSQRLTRTYFKNSDEYDEEGLKGILMVTNEGKEQLLTDRTMTSRLTPRIDYSYDETKELYRVTITIKYGDNEEFLSQTIEVKPIR